MVNLIGRQAPTAQHDTVYIGRCACTNIAADLTTACVLAGTLGWVGLGLFAFGPGTALLFLLLTNLGLAFGDVIVVSGCLRMLMHILRPAATLTAYSKT
jgi:hypothetical protein